MDIDPAAVDIAKLRLWLSLVVDEDDYQSIKPLPNLDYKVVCGNALLSVSKDITNYYLFDQLEDFKTRFFAATDPQEKQGLKIEIDSLISQLTHNNTQFDFEIYFSEVFHHEHGGFDIVFGNPPYGLINKRQNKTQGHIVTLDEINFYKNSPEYKTIISGMINVFQLFIIRSVNILNKKGIFTQIFPLAFIGDISSSKLRKYLLTHYNILNIEAFPERDNVKKRVFEGVKMSVCILNLGVKKTNSKFFIRVHQDRYVDPQNEKVFLDEKDIKLIDSTNYTIPLVRQTDLNIIQKVYSNRVGRINSLGHCYTGEIDLSFDKEYLTDDENDAVLIKGAIVDRYLIREKMSQGEIKFLDSNRYLSDNHSPKSQHYNHNRIVMQGITGVNEKVRLKMTLIENGTFCANSVNYLIFDNEKFNPKYILALLNSSTINFIFSRTSTNSNVNGYEIDNLPIMIDVNDEEQGLFITLVDYIIYLKKILPKAFTLEKSGDNLMVKFFDQIIDAMVYELYFSEDLHKADKYFIKTIMDEDLPELSSIKGDKVKALRAIYTRLFDKDHPLRRNLFFLDSLEIIRLIEGKV